MEKYQGFYICLIFIVGLNIAQACNGYKIRVKKMENCAGDDGVLKVYPNVTVRFNNNCKLVISGCGDTIGFSTANIEYTIKKNGNQVMKGKSDICEEMKKDSKGISTALLSFGLPANCPVDKMQKCANEEEIDISKQKAFLSLARGTIDIHIDGTHDTGKTCLNAQVEITK